MYQIRNKTKQIYHPHPSTRNTALIFFLCFHFFHTYLAGSVFKISKFNNNSWQKGRSFIRTPSTWTTHSGWFCLFKPGNMLLQPLFQTDAPTQITEVPPVTADVHMPVLFAITD